MTEANPQDYMMQALSLAEHGRLSVSPNPMVGCIIVNQNKMVGQGYHQRAGEAHAEILALNEAGEFARGATAYVTLEPCCHTGKTPPCTHALIAAGIKKVVVACQDANPLVAGVGIDTLRKAGIEVDVGLCADHAKKLNAVFFHYITHQRPFVIAKWAMSLDGKTTTHTLDQRDISSPASQHANHVMRSQVDAIMVGAKTAMQDNPLLTARIQAGSNVRQPLRVIVTTNAKLPLTLNLFNTRSIAKTLVATTSDIENSMQAEFSKRQIEVLILPKDASGRVALSCLLDELGKREITSLLVEGGMTLHESFFRENLVNKTQVYLAPVIIGSETTKKFLGTMQINQHAHDLCLTTDGGCV